jgi:hypothetical protein
LTVIFPTWTNKLPVVLAAGLIGCAVLAVSVVWYYFSPRHLEVGYAPNQPIFYSHKLHAGAMGMDCRYCHTSVETGPHANVPPTETCMNCHRKVRQDSSEIKKLTAAHDAGRPVEWVKVHMLPDYAYFNHAAHVRAGVGCASCHGRIDQMEIVRQAEPLSMGWCLDCHRQPENHLRPPDQVTNMAYEHDSLVGRELATRVNPPTHCSACHR